MREFLERHTDIAIFLIIFLEDLGVPMPLPADVVVVYAGYRLRQHTINPYLAITLMLVAVNLAATILFTVVRRGGRPLVDRYGSYLHLNAHRLTSAEEWLHRHGALAIVAGRTIPGIRLATVIACGLFKVPYRIFLPAQFAGVSIYLTFFLLIGYFLGPQAVERVHFPALSFRLLVLVVVVVALPLVLRRLNRRTADDDTRTIQATLTRGERIGAALLAGFAGAIELASIWAIVASLTRLMHRAEVQDAALILARWLDADEQPRAVAIAYTLDYLATLIACLVAAVIFFQFLMPHLRIGPRRLGRQTLVLWFSTVAVAAVAIGLSILHHVVRRPGSASLWFSHSGAVVLGIIVVGLLGYAYVAVEARRLAIDRFADEPDEAGGPAESISPETEAQPAVADFGDTV
jgi:membrane protein DedA with SNARE-associated domain